LPASQLSSLLKRRSKIVSFCLNAEPMRPNRSLQLLQQPAAIQKTDGQAKYGKRVTTS